LQELSVVGAAGAIVVLQRLASIGAGTTSVVVEHERPRIIDPVGARPDRAGDRVDIVARKSDARPELRVEPPDHFQEISPKRHVCAVDQAGGHERVGANQSALPRFLRGQRGVVSVVAEDPSS